MALYNLTNVSNSTNMGLLVQSVNDVTGGMLGAGFLITGWLILTIAMKSWSNKDAFAASTFGFTVIALLFFATEIVSETILIFFIIMSAVSAAILMLR